MKLEFVEPLTSRQVEAADRIHRSLDEWHLVDGALRDLARVRPEFDAASTLLKAAAINQLYATNVFALVRVAAHVTDVLSRGGWDSAGPELVDQLADVPRGGTERKAIRRPSFASKFAHFFIDEKRFPIYDRFAERMLRRHLGAPPRASGQSTYRVFCDRFAAVIKELRLEGEQRKLDRYLWIAGQYELWPLEMETVSSSLRPVFRKGGQDLLDLTGSRSGRTSRSRGTRSAP